MDGYFPASDVHRSADAEVGTATVFVKSLPPSISKENLAEIFGRFGVVVSLEITCGRGITNNALVIMDSHADAEKAMQELNGAPTSSGILEVSIGNPGKTVSTPLETIQEPGDNVYVRQLPGNWTEKELQDLFTPYGTVQECRVLHRGSEARGARALVRMASVAEATTAILALNGQVPRSMFGEVNHLPLLVRYADSPEEKARKQARKELEAAKQSRSLDLLRDWSNLPKELQHSANLRQASLPLNLGAYDASGVAASPVTSPEDSNPDPLLQDYQAQLNVQALLNYLYPSSTADSKMLLPGNGDMLAMNGHYESNIGSAASLPEGVPPATATVPAPQPSTYTSCYIKNAPPDANDLWVYERFAPFGAILSVKVLHEEGTTRCRGVCFVNYTTVEGAVAAIQAMNGRKVGDKTLHVSIQTRK